MDIAIIQSLFEGMDSVLSSKTVVGEPTRIDDTIIYTQTSSNLKKDAKDIVKKLGY